MQCQTYVRLLACGNDRLQKVSNVLPQLFVGVNSFLGHGGQALYLVKVERSVTRPTTALFQVVTLDGPMRVPVILDHRQTYFARGANRALEVLDLFITSRAGSSVDTV